MKKTISFAALVAFSFLGCGPDALATTMGEDELDVDGTETYDAELTATSRSNTWFPMQEGNTWTFKNASGTTRTVKFTQVGDGMALLTGLHAEPTWVGLTSDSATTLQQWGGSTWEPLVRFGYATTTWKTNSTTCKGLVGRRLSTGTAITTPAGSFTDTRSVIYAQVSTPSTLCAPPAFTELTFVPNVGLVSFKTGTGQRFNLVRATVNGREFPVTTSAELTASVVLDKASYVSYPNTIQCITQPCPSNADTAEAKIEFRLANTGSAAATWQFSSGCQFDLELVSSTGRVVRKLSDDRACTLSLTSLTLGAGQSKVYSATMPLIDKEGLQLSGTYTVRAKLIPSQNAASAPTATKSLQVSVLVP